MSIPPTFNSGDCGCTSGLFDQSCNPVGKCCFGNYNPDADNGQNNCPTESSGLLNFYNWPTSHMPNPTESFFYPFIQYVFPFHLKLDCSESEHFFNESGNSDHWNTFATVENGLCPSTSGSSGDGGGYMVGLRLNEFPTFQSGLYWNNFQGVPRLRCEYADQASRDKDRDALLIMESRGVQALTLRIRVIDQTNLTDQNGNSLVYSGDGGSTSVPAIGSPLGGTSSDPSEYVGRTYRYRFPFRRKEQGAETGSDFGLLDDLYTPYFLPEIDMQISEYLDTACSSPVPDFHFDYNPSTRTVDYTGLNEETNYWGVRFEYWWGFEGLIDADTYSSGFSCENFGSLASSVVFGATGLDCELTGLTLSDFLTDDAINDLNDSGGLGCFGLCNGSPINSNSLSLCMCDLCDCIDLIETCLGEDIWNTNIKLFCACCNGVGGQFQGVQCADCNVCGVWWNCGSCPDSTPACPNNCDCNTTYEPPILTTYKDCMAKKAEGFNSICWDVDPFSACPTCTAAGVVDPCGCFVNDSCSEYVQKCDNGGCLSVIPDASCTKGALKDFAIAAVNKNGEGQSNITLNMSAAYKDQNVYDYCGSYEVNNNAIENTLARSVLPQYYIDGLSELGNMRLIFDQTTQDTIEPAGRRCLPKNNFNENLELIRNSNINNVISNKMLQFCNYNRTNGRCATCNNAEFEYAPPVLMQGLQVELTLSNDKFTLKRGNDFNRFIAFYKENGTLSSSSSILTTNEDYSIYDIEEGVTQEITDVTTSLDEGFIQTEIYQSMANDTEKDKIKEDFTKLDSAWHIATYCKQDIRSNSVFRDNPDAYRFLSFAEEGGWWHTEIPLERTSYLRIWSTQVRSVYKSCFDFTEVPQAGGVGCTQDYDDVTAGCTFRLDHVYSKDSQTERGITKSNFDTSQFPNYLNTSVAYKRTETSCEDDGTCIFCNPWISKFNVGSQGCYSYIDETGSFVAETEGAMLIPMRPHTYQIEFWYVGLSGTPCGSEADYPTQFQLAGIVQSCPDCEDLYNKSIRDSVQVLKNNPNDILNQGVFNPYFDTCGSFFWQYAQRETVLKPYIVTNPPSDWGGSGQPETAPSQIPNVEFNDNFTTMLVLYPLAGGAFSSYVDTNSEANDIPTIKAVTAQNWNEDVWYHADPKHNFDHVARGFPQAMGRWTELPFKNYANEYLDLNETQLGFYLTLSAAHMSGIDRVHMYLDGATDGNGYVSLGSEYKHPKEECVAKVERDENGNLIDALEEYTVRIETDALTSGVHEVRAKIVPKSGIGRLLYGEPPTGNAEVLLKGETLGGRTEGEYKNWGPIDGQDWPLSRAKWPEDVPDGPKIIKSLDGKKYRNKFAAIGSTHKWNLANDGFTYYDSGLNKLTSSSNRYVFGATSQQNILFNGYESFWFNYNPSAYQVRVGSSAEVSSGDADVTTIAAAFGLLDTVATGSQRLDAEIILLPGTTGTPRKYHWPNSIDSESLTFTAGATWCQNALEKKSIVIKSKNPDSKSKTILWFPPGPDRVEMAWDNFALHVKDLTVYTSLTGSSVTQCLKSTGSNCRLLVENVDFESVCVTAIKASTLVDGSGDIICGDSLTRDSSGTVSGQIQYNKCRKIRDGEDNYQCSSDTTICGVNCCGVLANGSGCADCTVTSCKYCRDNCKCRMSEVQWWPFFSSDTVDLSSTGSNLTAEIDCGVNYPCTNSALSACKGIFDSDLVHTSDSYCLGTEKGECVILGLYNHDLMELADNDSWTMGIYAKSIKSTGVPGPVVKNPVMVKHFTVDNMTDTLICDEGHSLIMDLWVKNIDNYSDPNKQDTDIVKWSLDDFETKYGIKTVDDYDTSIGSPNPRGIYNFNTFIENRMMINIKVDNCHSRIINMPGPSLTVRDLVSSYNGHVNGFAGNPKNFGCFNYRNFLFKNFHLDEKADSHQIFGHVPINHLYFENFVVSSNVSKYCLSTDSSDTSCKNVPSGPMFPLTEGAVSSLDTKYLHYGRKQIQNLFIKDSVFHNLGTSDLLLETQYPSSLDYGGGKTGFTGSNFAIDGYRYFWVGSQGVKIENLRQVKNDYSNTSLVPNNYGGGSSFGPVVHKRSSPVVGRTSSANAVRINPYGPYNQWLVDNPSDKQKLSFGVSSTTSRITSDLPTICKTHIQGSVFKTADDLDACYDTTNGTCSGETDPFQFPSEAHSNFITEIEALSSGNLLDHGIPNVGGMKLSFANNKNYYHDICDYSGITCNRSGPLDSRNNQEESLTVISYDSGSGTYSWVTNTNVECTNECLRIRDHYFVDSDNYPVDLTWIPVKDECTCCDLDSTCTSSSS